MKRKNPVAKDLRTPKYRQRRVDMRRSPSCHYCGEAADPRFTQEGDRIICSVCGVAVDDI